MRDSNQIDWNVWLDTYRDTFASFSKAQHEGFRALERFARFHYAVAGDVLEASLAQAKATLGVRTAFGTQAIAEMLEKQAELGTQLTERRSVSVRRSSPHWLPRCRSRSARLPPLPISGLAETTAVRTRAGRLPDDR